jgi:hypothetical protein
MMSHKNWICNKINFIYNQRNKKVWGNFCNSVKIQIGSQYWKNPTITTIWNERPTIVGIAKESTLSFSQTSQVLFVFLMLEPPHPSEFMMGIIYESMSSKWCIDCVHYKSYPVRMISNISDRICFKWKDKEMNLWWKNNWNKSRDDTLTEMECFEQSEISKSLDKMLWLTDEMLENV